MKTSALLTSEQVEAARAEVAECDAKIAVLTARRNNAARLVEIAEELKLLSSPHIEAGQAIAAACSERAPFMFSSVSPGAEGTWTISTTSDAPTLIEAVTKVLQTTDHPLKPSEIRERLPTVGFNQSHGENYFYTVISRLEKRGTIARTSNRRYCLRDLPIIFSGDADK